jgi:hypothetical protein
MKEHRPRNDEHKENRETSHVLVSLFLFYFIVPASAVMPPNQYIPAREKMRPFGSGCSLFNFPVILC